jgi:hypothetical protein
MPFASRTASSRSAVMASTNEPRGTTDYLGGLRELARDHPRVGQRVILCLSPGHRAEDGILVLPAREFCRRLSAGDRFEWNGSVKFLRG